MEVEECAAPNASYWLSARLVKPERPPPWRRVRMRSRRPVENLVRVGLVADVPDQAVARGVEHPVQRDGELDHAEPRAQVAARDGDRIDRLLAQLVDQLPQVLLGKRAQVRRRLDLIEQGRLGGDTHGHFHRSRTQAVSSPTIVHFGRWHSKT